ncbi:gluconate 2-dehydrogenase subunit 3 family protein [Fibrisoma montanum]|uniref:Gluconate 2-dehydrogenase subunit 3 family protein n=1 Tax=Fibrisoma montanum TaxID=2305895 RepID=A0A418LY54_9BACT|nr:gluconate 2-dehydrogenase subunit 3 family protein [Fibrisoma montanum]RIV18277.1 gluconate 2-dehydrogenase subunit 3 family protein [Fibrisoma montanum]
MPYHYPEGTVRALLNTDHVTFATRTALETRLALEAAYEPRFFSAPEYALLKAVCDRLIPQTGSEAHYIDIARGIDERLARNESNGWRYDAMPPDQDAYRLGLAALEASAQSRHQQSFLHLAEDQQDALLTLIQQAEVDGEPWDHLPADRFFEELLAEAVENYYSHPLAQETIGYVGMADTPAWQRIGLNELDDREPRPL